MRIAVSLVVVAAIAAVSAAAQPGPRSSVPADASPGEALFVISGRGYGHGVGMSQFGAFGMARRGASYDEILAHYYSGTTLGRAGLANVRVLLAEGRPAVAISSTAPFALVDGSGRRVRVTGGAVTLRPDLMIPAPTGPVKAVPPLVVRPGKSVLSFDGRPYRGRLEVVPQDGFLRVVNYVGLEAYLRGVVAGEVPHTWPAEVLKAQAVAARSYALATRVKGKPFDLYSDARSQVYHGVASEQPATTSAVLATRGEVVLYAGKVATTYYFSTSGGRTASAEDVLGRPVPYLVSRPDPADRASPFHRWGPVLIGARTMQAKLGVDGRVLDITGITTPSRRLRALVVQTSVGRTTIPATVLRTALGLRSTWVKIGVLRLDRPRKTVIWGSKVRLSGLARTVAAPRVTSSVSGSLWTPVGPAERAAGGLASIVTKPERTLRYRLETQGAASPAVLVPVAPRLTLSPSEEPGVLVGTIRPRLARAAVVVERRTGAAWVPVATATVDRAGRFRVDVGTAAGSYRARAPAVAGLAEGVTPEVMTP